MHPSMATIIRCPLVHAVPRSRSCSMHGIMHIAHSGSYVMVIGTDMMCPAKAENSSDTTNEDNRESMLHAYDLGFSCKWNWISDYIMDDLNMTCILLLPESKKTDTGDLDDLETDTGNITLCLAATTEARDQNLVVLIDEVQATVILPPQVDNLFEPDMHKHSRGRRR